MQPIDLHDITPDTALEADVCVIGSGPAGITVALELARSGIDVVIVESGGREFEADTNALYDIDNVGLHRVPQHEVRVRQFGGTSTVWTGRCAPFRDIDYEQRSWVPASGWPFTAEDFAPYLGRAARYLGLAPIEYDHHAWSAITGKTPAQRLDPGRLVDELWQFSAGQNREPVRMNIDFAPDLDASPHIRTVLHANVLEIVPTSNGGAVDHVVISTLEGARSTVRAQSVVVCAGAIESARLLLASRSVIPAGLGNANDLVGRYYMEHPYCEVGTFDLNDDVIALLSRFGLFWHDERDERRVFMSGMALSPRIQRERQLLNCAMYVLPEESQNAAIHAARRLASGEGHAMHDVKTLLGSPLELAQAAKRRQLDGLPPIPTPDRVVIGANAEQRPDPDSRITLSDQVDALGMPLSRIDWRMDDQEFETIRTMLDLVTVEMRRLGLPEPQPSEWMRDGDFRSHVVDTAHHSSSVRMGTDPSSAVTDPSGHVFGVDGLFVAGSALFPTVGTANPTLMLAGMAVKVADAVRDRHMSPAPPRSIERSIEAAEPIRVGDTMERCRIGLVGSGHRVETIYLPVLEALGERVEVVGFTSRSADKRDAWSRRLDAPGFEDADALVSDASPDLVIAAVSADVNEAMTRHLLGKGTPLLVETPWAWSTDTGRDLLDHVGPDAVVGVAEQFPFLPMEQLRARVIADGVLGQIEAVHNESAAWDYHGIAQLRRYLGPMCAPESVRATAFSPMLADTDGDEPRPRDGYAATVLCAGGTVLSQRFINFYDQPLRANHHLTIDGRLGSIHDDEVRYIDRRGGQVAQASVIRTSTDGRLSELSVDLGPLGSVSWTNPFSRSPLNDEQIAVALHVEAMIGAAAGHGTSLYSPTDALTDVEVLQAIQLSAAHGGTVSLPLNTKLEKARKAASPEFVKQKVGQVTAKLRAKLGR